MSEKFLHGLYGEFVDQLVQVADHLHRRLFDVSTRTLQITP